MPETRQARNRTRTESTETPGTDHPRTASRRRFSILTTLLSLDAFVLGGLVALLIISRVLNSQLDAYATRQSMAEASTILDLLDDLLPLYVIYGAVLLVLLLITASTWVWMAAQSAQLRYGVILLCLAVLVVLGGMWLSRGSEEPEIPPITPTPAPAATDVVERGL